MTDDDYVAELRSYGMLSTNKAADRIEALTGEVRRWQGMFDEKHNLMLEHKARAKTAEAERDRLREALKHIISDCEADYPPSHGAIKYAAKLALKGETP